MIIESPLFGILLGLCTGIVIGYLWRDEQDHPTETTSYPEPQDGEQRPMGATPVEKLYTILQQFIEIDKYNKEYFNNKPEGVTVKQPEVKPIIVDTTDKYGEKTGFYINNWQEVIMNLTPEQNARTRRNVP